jgi:Tryptophan halogenase
MSSWIERITIVGGGTAGWLTALTLNARLNKTPKERRIQIALIESPNVPTIGVGESTIQNLKQTLEYAGIDEAEFIRRSNGSFKLGVRYIDWSRANGQSSSNFFHPLNSPQACGGLHPAYHFRRFGPHWLGASFGENMMANAAVIAAGKGPRQLIAGNYRWDLNYAYHVDAALLADFMRDFAVARGVEHIRDDVVDVLLGESGEISALQLERRGQYPVEFVIDCTGFKSLIWSRMGAEPFTSVGDRLLNDRAIPVQIPHRDPTRIEPCTRAIALDAGWVWRVPLYSRVGTGYVYSSAFRSDDEARAEFIAAIRANGDLPAGAPDPETRVIKIRTGYTRQPWIKNCVAIGLSSGFVEPLEATAIFTIDAAAHWLIMNYPDTQCSPALAKAYNARVTALMEEIVDFLQLVYVTSNRTEPYWVAVREEARLSDWLREKLELWRFRFPDLNDTLKNMLFDSSNFLYVLYPKGYFAKTHSPLDRLTRLEDWQAFGRELKEITAKHLRTLPSHYDLLTNIRASASGRANVPDPNNPLNAALEAAPGRPRAAR